MCGIGMLLMVAGSPTPKNFGGSVSADDSTGAYVSATFGTDGSITVTADGDISSSDTVSPHAYLSAVMPGAGASYWIRATLQSGVNPNSSNPGFGVWLQLSAARTWAYGTSTAKPYVRGGTILFEIARDSAGSSIACSGSISFNASTTL